MIICKVCGARVTSEVACCARCFTPHHFDCWTFTGQCSIYACGCTEHRYFDFREKSEAEVLEAIGLSLALALRSEPQEPGETRPADREASSPVDEVLVYKRNLFRSLQAVLAKVAPGRSLGEELAGSLEEELGESRVPSLYLADDLAIEESHSGARDLAEKRRLLHSMADVTGPSDAVGPPEGAFRSLVEWLRRLLGRPGARR